MPWCKAIAGGVELTLKVVPGASRSRVVGPLGDALKVQVAAPPEKGKANAAVIELIAATLGVAVRSVRLVRGEAQPRKIIQVDGVSVEEARAAMTARAGER